MDNARSLIISGIFDKPSVVQIITLLVSLQPVWKLFLTL